MDDTLLLSLFVAVEGAHGFSAFMPSAFTVRTFAHDEKDIANLRTGYIPALAFILSLALVLAAIKRSVLPVVLAATTAAGMVALYENSIRAASREIAERQVA